MIVNMTIVKPNQESNNLDSKWDRNELSNSDKSVVDNFLWFVDDMLVVANPKNWLVPNYSDKKEFRKCL